jgi:hypothetical protein
MPESAEVAVQRGEASDFICADLEGGIDHFERIEDRLLQIVGQRHAADQLYQIAANVGGDTVIPQGSGLRHQRKFEQGLQQLLDGLILQPSAPDPGIEFVDREPVGLESVAETRGVGQQLANRDVGLDFSLLVNFEFCQRRDPAFGGVVELEMPLFHQAHQGHAGNRLGHRINAEDRVWLNRPLAGDVGMTVTG